MFIICEPTNSVNCLIILKAPFKKSAKLNVVLILSQPHSPSDLVLSDVFGLGLYRIIMCTKFSIITSFGFMVFVIDISDTCCIMVIEIFTYQKDNFVISRDVSLLQKEHMVSFIARLWCRTCSM